MQIFLVRHGATDYNKAPKRIQGQCDRSLLAGVRDMPLNADGKAEALRAVERIASLNLGALRLVASPLLRAQQTATFFAERFGVPLTSDTAFAEMFFGSKWDGMEVDAFKEVTFSPTHIVPDGDGSSLALTTGANLREVHKSTDPRYDLVCHPGGETKREVAIRARSAIDELFRNIAIPTVIVTHSVVIRVLLSSPFGLAAIPAVVTTLDGSPCGPQVVTGDIVRVQRVGS